MEARKPLSPDCPHTVRILSPRCPYTVPIRSPDCPHRVPIPSTVGRGAVQEVWRERARVISGHPVAKLHEPVNDRSPPTGHPIDKPMDPAIKSDQASGLKVKMFSRRLCVQGLGSLAGVAQPERHGRIPHGSFISQRRQHLHPCVDCSWLSIPWLSGS